MLVHRFPRFSPNLLAVSRIFPPEPAKLNLTALFPFPLEEIEDDRVEVASAHR